jgi:hypothetical protein
MDAPEFIEFTRQIGDRGTGVDAELMATRGERLALFQMVSHFSDEGVGPSELEALLLLEINEGDEIQSIVRFDSDDLDAAYDEIEARFLDAEGEAVRAALHDFTTARDRGDWDALAAACAPHVVAHDHRLAGYGTLRGPAEMVAAQRAMIELAPDARTRTHHVRVAPRAMFTDTVWFGTRDGGVFESPVLTVNELDPQGRHLRIDVYDPDHRDAALAQFDELANRRGPAETSGAQPAKALVRLSNPLDIPPNLATRAADASADLQGRRELVTPDFRFEDRQKHAQVVGDIETWIQSGRYVQKISRMERVLVSTLGERIAIYEIELEGAPGQAEFSHEQLCLYETDADGKLRGFVLFDPDQPGAVHREAEARFAAGEATAAGTAHRPIAAMSDAVLERDWHALARILAPDVVIRDHRRLRLGRLDKERWIESLRALTELAPDMTVVTRRILAWNERGRVALATSSGHGPEGAAFENLFLSVISIEGECVRSYEAFDLEDVDRALARFEELCGG